MSQSPKSRLERVFASVPLNGTAARVANGGSAIDTFNPVVDYGDTRHFLVPPSMIPVSKLNPEARAKARELIGATFGRFTVVGYAQEQHFNSKRPARWVVRCVCGAYAYRSAKAIRNPANSMDRCKTCRDTAYAKRTYEQLGPRQVAEFIKSADEK